MLGWLSFVSTHCQVVEGACPCHRAGVALHSRTAHKAGFQLVLWLCKRLQDMLHLRTGAFDIVPGSVGKVARHKKLFCVNHQLHDIKIPSPIVKPNE